MRKFRRKVPDWHTYCNRLGNGACKPHQNYPVHPHFHSVSRMKNSIIGLALGLLAALPACTIRYYGPPPGDGRDGPYRNGRYSNHTYEYHTTDTVYINHNTTTVVHQPNGGYPNGGTRYPGGTRSNPNGGGNYPNGGGNYPNGGGNYPNGGGNNPNGGGGNYPNGGNSQPNGNQSYPNGGTHTGTNTPPPIRTGGIKPMRDESGPGIRTGGIKPMHDNPNPTGGAADPAYPTGGIKPMHDEPGPDIRTGGIKPMRDNPDPNIRTGGVKPMHGEPDPDIRTGGIKPMRDEPSPDIRTGGIKPMRDNPSPSDQPSPDYPTGGIKPIPGTGPTRGGGEANQPGGSGEQPTGELTGGIKPIRGGNAEQGGLTNNATPALVFAKMPSRGPSPSYTATVWPNGRVVYVGQQNVPRLGTFELQLPAATLATIQQQAQGVNFPELQESYASGATDIPATRLTMFDRAGGSKTVTVEDNAPAEVQALFDYINNELTQLAGAGGTEEAPQTMRRAR